MIIQEQTVRESATYDMYRTTAVLDELSRPTRRRLGRTGRVTVWSEFFGRDTVVLRIARPVGTLVAPRWKVYAVVDDDDLAQVTWLQEVVLRPATGPDAGSWIPLSDPERDGAAQVAGIRYLESHLAFDLRTGVILTSKAIRPAGAGRRVRPSREDTRLFAAWLRQWLPDRSPIKNPKRSRR
jgi:hypothetical protein